MVAWWSSISVVTGGCSALSVITWRSSSLSVVARGWGSSSWVSAWVDWPIGDCVVPQSLSSFSEYVPHRPSFASCGSFAFLTFLYQGFQVGTFLRDFFSFDRLFDLVFF